MFIATCRLKSVSPLSFSRHYEVDRLDKESDRDYEIRTWRERCHTNEKGTIFIPAMAFKKNITEAAEYSPKKIKGKRNATYTKHFRAGLLVTENVDLGIAKSDVICEECFVPSDGKVGGGSRVTKYFPVIKEWAAEVEYTILDNEINREVFEDTLYEGGQFIGVGRFRPIRGGFYGRFDIEGGSKGIDWKEIKR